MLQAGSQRR